MTPSLTDYQSDFYLAAAQPVVDDANRWWPSTYEPCAKNRKSTSALKNFFEQLNELILLPANWDSYNSCPLNFASVQYSIYLFYQIMFENTPCPQLVPTNVGTIQFEWHIYGIDLEIEICSSRIVHCYISDSQQKFATSDWSDSLLYAAKSIKLYTEELTDRAISSNSAAA